MGKKAVKAAQHVGVSPDSRERLVDAIDAVNLADRYALDIEEWCSEITINSIELGKTKRLITAIECLTERLRARLCVAKEDIEMVRAELNQHNARAALAAEVRHD